MKFTSAIFICLLVNNNFEKIISENLFETTNISEVIDYWKEFNEHLNINLDFLTSGFSSNFEMISREANISENCFQSFQKLLIEAKANELTALRVFGSWGKLPTTETLELTFTNFGNYDSCMNIDEIETHYCSVKLRLLLPQRPRFHLVYKKIDSLQNIFNNRSAINVLANHAHLMYYSTFRIGVCLPRTCTFDDVERTMRIVGEHLRLKGEAINCLKRKPIETKFNVYQILSLIFFASVLLLAAIGTLLDIFWKNEATTTIHKSLLAFSLRRNVQSIFKIENTRSDLKCFSGIRFWTITWIIFGHTTDYIHYDIFREPKKLLEYINGFGVQWLLNATLSVDSFFLMSGVLTSYVTLTLTDGNYKAFSVFGYLVSRYVRLIPGVLAVIAGTFFLPLLGDGPIFDDIIEPVVHACERYWWRNLLFIQNFGKVKDLCVAPTWWLAADYQFHVASLFAIVCFLRKPIYGVFCTLLLFFTAFAIGVYTYVNTDFPPTQLPSMIPMQEIKEDYNAEIFVKPFIHAGPFFVGLLLGFLLAKRKRLDLGQYGYKIGWTLTIVAMIVNLQSIYWWTNGVPYTNLEATLYANTMRTLWAACLAWIIYASYAGHGGIVESFLCWNGFTLFARLTYMTYLTHMWVLKLYTANRKTNVHIDMLTLAYIFIPHWVISYAVGFLFTIFFESPFLALQKLFFKKHRPVKKKEDEHEKLALTIKSDHNANIEA